MLALPRRACWVILLTSSSQARNIHKHSALENCARLCTKTQTSSKTQFSRSLQTNYASRLGLGADVSRLVGQRETLEFRATGSDCKRKSRHQTNKQRCIYTRAKARRVWQQKCAAGELLSEFFLLLMVFAKASVTITIAHIGQQTSNPKNSSLTCPAAIPLERFNPNASLCAGVVPIFDPLPNYSVAPHCRTKIQGAGLDPRLGGGDGRFRGGDG